MRYKNRFKIGRAYNFAQFSMPMIYLGYGREGYNFVEIREAAVTQEDTLSFFSLRPDGIIFDGESIAVFDNKAFTKNIGTLNEKGVKQYNITIGKLEKKTQEIR